MRILLPVFAVVILSFLTTGIIIYYAFHKEIDKLASENGWNIAYRYAGDVREYLYTAPIYIESADCLFYLGFNAAKDEVYEALDNIEITISLVMLLALLISAAVILYVVRGLMRELGGEPRYVTGIVNRIATGDFTVTLNIQGNNSKSLANAVNGMVGKLKSLINNIYNISEHLKLASSTLSSGVSQLSSGTEEQSEQASRISAASEEMSATTSEIANSLDEITNFSSKTVQEVENGMRAVEEAVNEIVKIKDTVDESAKLVNLLGDKSLEIKNIVSVITGIADQTNLLALNAAIEAARAGEAGRGFAVVADEVRKLAENTQKATTEIANLVREIQNEMVNTTDSMQVVTSQVNNGVSKAKDTTAVLDNIHSVVLKLQGMVENIAAATDEMSVTSSQIQQNISNVATVSGEVRTTAGYLAESAVQLDTDADKMKDMLDQFKI
jgi:methyl-accepting chemotaxis protein